MKDCARMRSRRLPWHTWLVVVAMVSLTGCAGTSTDATGFSWSRFRGTTLRILLAKSHWQQTIVKYIAEFHEQTGINAQVEVLSQDDLWNRLENDLKTPGQVDVFSFIPGLEGVRYARAKNIQPIDTFLTDPALTAPDYRWDDFLPKFRSATMADGATLGPPVMVEHLALLYRKDVFAQNKVVVPKTLEELVAVARLLHHKPMGSQGAPGVGIVSRGQGVMATGLYAGLLHAMGGTWLDDRGQPTIAGPQSLAALEWMSRVFGQFAPPNMATFGWQEASALFLQGRAAMYVEGSSIYPLIEDEGSRIARKVGYAVFPSGPAGPATTVAVRSLAIAKGSQHPEAAWLFLQWASSPAMVRKALMHGVLVARESAWHDSVARSEVPADLAESLQEAGRVGVTAWAPPVVAITSAREAVGHAISAAMKGEDIRAAAETADRRLRDILAYSETAGKR